MIDERNLPSCVFFLKYGFLKHFQSTGRMPGMQIQGPLTPLVQLLGVINMG